MFRIHSIDFTISSYFSISSEQTHVPIFRFLTFLTVSVQLTYSQQNTCDTCNSKIFLKGMFITKLSEVNSCINQALGKQTAPLSHFSSAQGCQTGLLDPFSRDMFSIMLALVTPSCSLRLPEELRVIHAVSAAL